MNISRGYVRLFRQIDEWEWYDNPYVKAIFLHCLLKANDKAKDWRDLKIKRETGTCKINCFMLMCR